MDALPYVVYIPGLGFWNGHQDTDIAVPDPQRAARYARLADALDAVVRIRGQGHMGQMVGVTIKKLVVGEPQYVALSAPGGVHMVRGPWAAALGTKVWHFETAADAGAVAALLNDRHPAPLTVVDL